jgi:hypothetical protein
MLKVLAPNGKILHRRYKTGLIKLEDKITTWLYLSLYTSKKISRKKSYYSG